MKLYGLIGYPLHHSFSKGYFTEKFQKEGMKDHAYLNFQIKNIDELENVVRSHNELRGFNVTIPFKEKIIACLCAISKDALGVGAVNTVRIERSENRISLIGYNTDVDGFRDSLLRIIRPDISNALILGTGGASKAVSYVLEELKISFLFVSRKKSENSIVYNDLNKKIIESSLLIINTTPLGTFPEINTFPDIPYECITPSHILFDLVYNPPETVFLREGKKRGATITNGLDMLYEQAEQAWLIWNNPDVFETADLRKTSR